MEKYIPLDALVAEINKRITNAPINNIGHQRVWAYNDVKDIIDSLEVKEVDLEKEMDKEWNKCEPIDEGMGLEITSIEHEQFDNIAKHFFELGVSCPINHINIEEVKAAAKAWSEDDENTRGCDYIGAVVAERAFVACAEWLINKAMKGE